MKKPITSILALTAGLAAPSGVVSQQNAPDLMLQEIRTPVVVPSLTTIRLETIRARDEELLRTLAAALHVKHGELLEGTKILFTRVESFGTVFYRMDIQDIEDEDKARRLCQILEMERCLVARPGVSALAGAEVRGLPVGNDGLLDVTSAPAVTNAGPSGSVEMAPLATRPQAPSAWEGLDRLAALPMARPDVDDMASTGDGSDESASMVGAVDSASVDDGGQERQAGAVDAAVAVAVGDVDAASALSDEMMSDEVTSDDTMSDVGEVGVSVGSDMVSDATSGTEPEIVDGDARIVEQVQRMQDVLMGVEPVDEQMDADDGADDAVEEQSRAPATSLEDVFAQSGTPAPNLDLTPRERPMVDVARNEMSIALVDPQNDVEVVGRVHDEAEMEGLIVSALQDPLYPMLRSQVLAQAVVDVVGEKVVAAADTGLSESLRPVVRPDWIVAQHGGQETPVVAQADDEKEAVEVAVAAAESADVSGRTIAGRPVIGARTPRVVTPSGGVSETAALGDTRPGLRTERADKVASETALTAFVLPAPVHQGGERAQRPIAFVAPVADAVLAAQNENRETLGQLPLARPAAKAPNTRLEMVRAALEAERARVERAKQADSDVASGIEGVAATRPDAPVVDREQTRVVAVSGKVLEVVEDAVVADAAVSGPDSIIVQADETTIRPVKRPADLLERAIALGYEPVAVTEVVAVDASPVDDAVFDDGVKVALDAQRAADVAAQRADDVAVQEAQVAAASLVSGPDAVPADKPDMETVVAQTSGAPAPGVEPTFAEQSEKLAVVPSLEAPAFWLPSPRPELAGYALPEIEFPLDVTPERARVTIGERVVDVVSVSQTVTGVREDTVLAAVAEAKPVLGDLGEVEKTVGVAPVVAAAVDNVQQASVAQEAQPVKAQQETARVLAQFVSNPSRPVMATPARLRGSTALVPTLRTPAMLAVASRNVETVSPISVSQAVLSASREAIDVVKPAGEEVVLAGFSSNERPVPVLAAGVVRPQMLRGVQHRVMATQSERIVGQEAIVLSAPDVVLASFDTREMRPMLRPDRPQTVTLLADSDIGQALEGLAREGIGNGEAVTQASAVIRPMMRPVLEEEPVRVASVDVEFSFIRSDDRYRPDLLTTADDSPVHEFLSVLGVSLPLSEQEIERGSEMLAMGDMTVTGTVRLLADAAPVLEATGPARAFETDDEKPTDVLMLDEFITALATQDVEFVMPATIDLAQMTASEQTRGMLEQANEEAVDTAMSMPDVIEAEVTADGIVMTAPQMRVVVPQVARPVSRFAVAFNDTYALPFDLSGTGRLPLQRMPVKRPGLVEVDPAQARVSLLSASPQEAVSDDDMTRFFPVDPLTRLEQEIESQPDLLPVQTGDVLLDTVADSIALLSEPEPIPAAPSLALDGRPQAMAPVISDGFEIGAPVPQLDVAPVGPSVAAIAPQDEAPLLGNGAFQDHELAVNGETRSLMDMDTRRMASGPDESLMIRLSYVTSLPETTQKVDELRRYFPPLMLEKGRFFGKAAPASPDLYVIGIMAHNTNDFRDLVEYMTMNGIVHVLPGQSAQALLTQPLVFE